MNKIIFVGFDTGERPHAGGRALEDMHRDGGVSPYHPAVVVREPSGAVALQQVRGLRPIDTVCGVVTGTLVGLIVNAVKGEREMPTSHRVVSAARHAHVSHEVRAIRSLAEDAVEDGVHAARRAVRSAKRGIEKLQDFRDDAAHYVKRNPLTAVAIAGVVGTVVGLATGWIVRRPKRKRLG